MNQFEHHIEMENMGKGSIMQPTMRIIKMQNNYSIEEVNYEYTEYMDEPHPQQSIENERYGITFPHPYEKNQVMLYPISTAAATTFRSHSQKLLFEVFAEVMHDQSNMTTESEDDLFKKCVTIRDVGLQVLTKRMDAIIDMVREDLGIDAAADVIKRHLRPDTKKTKYATDRFKYLINKENALLKQVTDFFMVLQLQMDEWRKQGFAMSTMMQENERVGQFIEHLQALYAIKLDIVHFVKSTLLCPYCGQYGKLLHFTYFKTKSNWKKHLRKLCNHKPCVFEELQMQLIELMIKATSASETHETWLEDALRSEIERSASQRIGMIRWCFQRLACRNPFVISKTLYMLMHVICFSANDRHVLQEFSAYEDQLEGLSRITGFGLTQNTRVHDMANKLLSMLRENSMQPPPEPTMLVQLPPPTTYGYVSGNHVDHLETVSSLDPSTHYNTMDHPKKVNNVTRLRSSLSNKVSSIRQFMHSKMKKGSSTSTEDSLKLYIHGQGHMFSTFKRALSNTAASTLSSLSHYLNQCLHPSSTSPNDRLDRVLSAIAELIKTDAGFHYFQEHSSHLEQLSISSKARDILSTLHVYRDTPSFPPLLFEEESFSSFSSSDMMSDDDDVRVDDDPFGVAQTLVNFDFDAAIVSPPPPPSSSSSMVVSDDSYPSLDHLLSSNPPPFNPF